MKIGILTFWWAHDNYGQLLQAYALQKYLRDLGHDAFLIRYNSENDIIRTPLLLKLLKALNPIRLARFFIYKRRIVLAKKEQSENPRHFDDFRKKYIAFSKEEYNSYADLKSNPPDADMYIVGSDQVWNFYNIKAKRMRNVMHAYFLDFGGDNVRRVSYAASWGRLDIPRDQRDEIVPLIKQFDFITVREKSGVDVCKSFGMDSEWVCDPTLLLDAEVYRTLYKDEGAVAPEKPYVLFYYLDNGGKFNKESVWKFAGAHNLDVQYVSGNSNVDKCKKNFATIPEWLSLVDGADFVITNSFHCCVFSILFKKRFGAIKMTGPCSGMNERLESLLEMAACGERYVSENDFSALDKACDWSGEFILHNFFQVIKHLLYFRRTIRF